MFKSFVNALILSLIIVLTIQLLVPTGYSPNPGPDIKPVVPGMHVLIAEETSAGTSPAWLQGAKIDAFKKSHCAKVADTPEFRVLDKDQDVSHLSQDWQQALVEANKHADQLPWQVIWGVRKPVSEKLLSTEDAELSELQAHSR